MFQHVYQSEDLVLCRQSFGGREGELSTLELQWLAARAGQGIEHFTERHEMLLCPRDVMKEIFEEAGFEMTCDDGGLNQRRGLFVGRRLVTWASTSKPTSPPCSTIQSSSARRSSRSSIA